MLLPSFNSSHVLIGVLELSSAILAANAFSKNTATGNGDLARGNAAFGFQINKLSALPTSHRRHRRKSCRLGLSKSGSDVDSDEANCHSNTLKNGHVHGRRSMLHYVGLSLAGTVSSGPLSALLRAFGDDDSAVTNAGPANAMGLVQFPCPAGTLANTYHMMRAGESGLEAMDILSTNPLFL